MIKLVKKYWLSITYIILIFVGCFMNPSSLPAAPMYNFDKVVHILLFFGLSIVLFFDTSCYLRCTVSKIRIILIVFLFPIILGGLIEIIQEIIKEIFKEILPYSRSGDWFDFVCDVIGAFLGLGFALLINLLLSLRKK